MNELILRNVTASQYSDPIVLAWDGRVLEIFGVGDPVRFHLRHLAPLEITEEKRGGHQLQVAIRPAGGVRLKVADEDLASASDFAEGVNSALHGT
jgi:hypothetical protein